uniref:DUF4939 domain-containing protein n=1 Tax=Pseudonaja textilis TaxID=8673 RepID=A0A670Z8J6_PSETE
MRQKFPARKLTDRGLRPELEEPGNINLKGAPPLRKSPVSMPEKFSGQMDMFPAFLGQCQLFMSLRPEDFPNDRAKVGFIISLLSGQAAKWATPLLTQDSPLLDNFQGGNHGWA